MKPSSITMDEAEDKFNADLSEAEITPMYLMWNVHKMMEETLATVKELNIAMKPMSTTSI